MARFARDCQDAFRDVVWKLQFTLGPDTGKSLIEGAYLSQSIHELIVWKFCSGLGTSNWYSFGGRDWGRATRQECQVPGKKFSFENAQ